MSLTSWLSTESSITSKTPSKVAWNEIRSYSHADTKAPLGITERGHILGTLRGIKKEKKNRRYGISRSGCSRD